jgi:dienelactone hydrolase
MHSALRLYGSLRCARDPAASEIVEFHSTAVLGEPVMLRGYLRRPSGTGPIPAVVLLHGCAGFAESLDQKWGPKLAKWGYVILTVDSFSARGLQNGCRGGPPIDAFFDAYRALDFLEHRSSMWVGP